MHHKIKISMKEVCENQLMQAYKKQIKFMFTNCLSSSLPLTYEDSFSPVPNHPFCALGLMHAEGEWGSKKGIAFVIDDNYLLTCASNVYQNQQGKYPNITFTINSNRTSGYDTHKVSKVFIPQQYKTLPQKQKNRNNYALIFIEGKPKMKERYGGIGINFLFDDDYYYWRTLTTLECSPISNELLLINQHAMNQQLSNILSGTPINISSEQSFHKQANGLIIQSCEDIQPVFQRFNPNMKNQLDQWVQSQANYFELSTGKLNSISAEEFDASCLKDEKIRPIDTINMYYCHFAHRVSFFEQLSFSPIYQFTLRIFYDQSNNSQLGDNLSFLQLSKFRNLKDLSLYILQMIQNENQIGQLGCKFIVSLSFEDLRCLKQSNNPLGNQGCRHFSTAKWPKLLRICLTRCQIGSQGILFLIQQKWRNLTYLQLGSNRFDGEISSILEVANIPRIFYLYLGNFRIYRLQCSLRQRFGFPKSPSWKSLRQLDLYDCKVGNMGCKMIKQANIIFTKLSLTNCSISWIGVKWLCKADLTKIQVIGLYHNIVGDKGCFYLSQAKMPKIIEISLTEETISICGFRWLFKSDWAKRVNYKYSCLDKMAEIFGINQFLWYIQSD